MKAIRFSRYGDSNVLKYEDAPIPQPGAGEVRVRVLAAGVNPADTQFRRGDYQTFAPRPLPFILGWDLAGVVDAVGKDAHRFQPNTAVFGMADMSRNGAYAEYIVLRETDLTLAPKSLTPQQAAAVPLAALTAWKAVHDAGDVRSGQRVLIQAGAGGVGQFAVQFAHQAGAVIVATASPKNHALLRGLGADHALDYRGHRYDGSRGFDAVIDCAGGDTRAATWSSLNPGGVMVCVAMPPPDMEVARTLGLRAEMVSVVPDGQRLADIAAQLDSGMLRVRVDREFPLSQAAAAHLYIEQRHACGKVVLNVA